MFVTQCCVDSAQFSLSRALVSGTPSGCWEGLFLFFYSSLRFSLYLRLVFIQSLNITGMLPLSDSPSPVFICLDLNIHNLPVSVLSYPTVFVPVSEIQMPFFYRSFFFSSGFHKLTNIPLRVRKQILHKNIVNKSF